MASDLQSNQYRKRRRPQQYHYCRRRRRHSRCLRRCLRRRLRCFGCYLNLGGEGQEGAPGAVSPHVMLKQLEGMLRNMTRPVQRSKRGRTTGPHGHQPARRRRQSNTGESGVFGARYQLPSLERFVPRLATPWYYCRRSCRLVWDVYSHPRGTRTLVLGEGGGRVQLANSTKDERDYVVPCRFRRRKRARMERGSIMPSRPV